MRRSEDGDEVMSREMISGRSARTAAALLALAAVMLASPAVSLAASAEENYRFYCMQCHGEEGKGNGPNATRHMPVDPRDHTSAYEMSKLTDKEIIAAITDGGTATSKSSLMPPFGKTLTRAEIIALKDHIRKLCSCTAR